MALDRRRERERDEKSIRANLTDAGKIRVSSLEADPIVADIAERPVS